MNCYFFVGPSNFHSKYISKNLIHFFIFLVSLIGLQSCNQSEEKKGAPIAPLRYKLDSEVTKETYLNGEQFCSTYRTTTQSELGKWIEVPLYYKDPGKGTTKIYAWTSQRFDESKPSYVIVDGGPGQNTHGLKSIVESDAWNEIHFDQRGLGCSSFTNFEMYKTADLYSTTNTVLDMDEIRKFFQIKKWSVYGISYGTVPSTRYGSQFPDNTTAIAIEGVVFNGSEVHRVDWKVEKLNLVLDSLTSSQRRGFLKVLKSPDANVLTALIGEAVYSDAGFRNLGTYFSALIRSEDDISWDRLDQLKAIVEKSEYSDQPNSHPQKPMGVDRQVHGVIFCKELDYGKLDSYLDFDESKIAFVQKTESSDAQKKMCESRGIFSTEKSYVASDYPVKVPVTYFQGSHDGATMSSGALLHWKNVPQGEVNFLLAQKGGHNPNLTRIFTEKDDSKSFDYDARARTRAERKLFISGLSGAKINQNDVDEVNRVSASFQKWLIFHSAPSDFTEIKKEFEGIRRLMPAGQL